MRAVIVDDSAEDRLNLRALLRRCRGIEIAGEAADVESARRLLAAAPADLLFLDIQIGRENGFDLLSSLSPRPKVIVTTVHRQYGDRAFDYDVADYLVKPVTDDRLQRALVRASREDGADVLERVAVHRSGSARHVIALETIVAVVGDDKYSRVFSGSQEFLDHRNLRDWQELLGALGFERIDRSTLIRVDRIASVVPLGRGARIAFLRSPAEIEVGRAGRERLEDIFGERAC